MQKEGTRKILENDKPEAKCTTERANKAKSHFSIKINTFDNPYYEMD